MKQGKKLVKWSAYVIELGKHKTFLSSNEYRMINYANFLHQNLSDRYTINGFDAHPFNRFIPTDKEGNILDKPKNWDNYIEFSGREVKGLKKEIIEYQEAVDRTVFKGFKVIEVSKWLSVLKNAEKDCQVLAKQNDGEWYLCQAFKITEDLCELELDFTSIGENIYL